MDTSHRELNTPPFAIATATGHVVFAEGLMLCASSGPELVLQSRNKLFAPVTQEVIGT